MSDLDLDEITPLNLRCPTASCPGVFRLEDGNLLIIGKKVKGKLKAQLCARIGSDEEAVVIAREFLEGC